MNFQAVLRVWVLVAFGVAGCASTQSRGQTTKIDELNAAAVKDYQAGKPRDAEKKLAQALEEAEKAKLGNDPSVAAIHMNRGVVLASGLKRKSRGVEAMVSALKINPQAKPPEALRDARVDSAFAQAKERVSAEPAPAVAAAAVAPPPEPSAPAPAEVAAKSESPAKRGKGKKGKKGKGGAAAAAAPELASTPSEPAPTSAPSVASRSPSAAASASGEAALPSPLPEPIFCPLPDQVPPGKEIAVWCGVDAALKARSVTLFVRPRNQTDFVSLPMKQSERGWWVASIKDDLVGSSGLLQFYVQAEGANDKVVANAADAYSPDVLMIRPNAKAVPSVLTQAYLDGQVDVGSSSGSTSEDPFAKEDPLAKQPDAEAAETPAGWDRVWIGLQAGAAYGWHAAADLELRKDIEVSSGGAGAGLVNILPEIGYQLTPNWGVAVQSRHQIVGEKGIRGGAGEPATGANSILLRAIYSLDVSRRLSLLGTAAVGGGEGVRMVMEPSVAKGRPGTDTVMVGRFLAGAGVGGAYWLSKRFSLTAELRALVGLPNFGVVGELNLGARYSFGNRLR